MSKTVRVEIETDDGAVITLTGDAADLWQRQLQHASDMACAHGSQFERLPWVETKRDSGYVRVLVSKTAQEALKHAVVAVLRATHTKAQQERYMDGRSRISIHEQNWLAQAARELISCREEVDRLCGFHTETSLSAYLDKNPEIAKDVVPVLVSREAVEALRTVTGQWGTFLDAPRACKLLARDLAAVLKADGE